MSWNFKSSIYLSKVFSELPDEDLYGCIRNQMLINVKPQLILQQDELRCSICGVDSEVVLPRVEITNSMKMKNSARRNILESRLKMRSNYETLQYKKYRNRMNLQTMINTCASCGINSEFFVKKPLNLLRIYQKNKVKRKKSRKNNFSLDQYKRSIETEETSSAKRQKINHESSRYRKNNLTNSNINKTKIQNNHLIRIDENNFKDFIPLEMYNKHRYGTSPADVIEIIDSPRQSYRNGPLQTIGSPSNHNENNLIEIIDSPRKEIRNGALRKIGSPSHNNENNVIEIVDSPTKEISIDTLQKIGSPSNDNNNIIEIIDSPLKEIRNDTLQKTRSPSNDNENNVIEIIDSPLKQIRNDTIQKIGSPSNNNENNVIEIIDSPLKEIRNDTVKKIGSPSNDNENNVIDIIDSPEKYTRFKQINNTTNNKTNVIVITDSPQNNGIINLDPKDSPNCNGNHNILIEITDSPSNINENNDVGVIENSPRKKTVYVPSNSRFRETIRENQSNSTSSEESQSPNGYRSKKKTLETYNSSKKVLNGLSKLLKNNEPNPKHSTLLQGFLRNIT